MKKTLFVTLLFVSALATSWVYRDTLEKNAVSRIISFASRVYLGNKLQYSTIERNGGTWTLVNPVLTTHRARLQAEKVVSSLRFNLWERRLHLKIEVITPEIFVTDSKHPQTLFPQTLPASLSYFPFIQLTSNIRVEGGILYWKDGVDEKRSTFALHANTSPLKQSGDLAIAFNAEDTSSNTFFLKVVEKNNSPKEFVMNFNELDCLLASKSIGGIDVFIPDWDLTQGNIDGDLLLTMNGTKAVKALGDIAVKNLDFRHRNGDVNLHLKEMHFSLEKSNAGAAVAKGEITKEATATLMESGTPIWEVAGVRGKIEFDLTKGLLLNLEGECRLAEEKFSLAIAGEGHFPGGAQGSASLRVTMESPDKEPASAHFVARQLGKLYNFAEVSFEHIGEKELNFLKYPLDRVNPDMKNLSFQKGELNASGLAYFKHYRLTEMKINQIEGNNIEFSFAPLNLTTNLEKVTGNLTFDLSSHNIFSTIDSSLSLSEGKVSLLTPEGESWEFKNLNSNIFVKEGIVRPSSVTGFFAGLKGEINIDGLNDERVVLIHFKGKTNEIASIAPSILREGIKNHFSEDLIEITAEVDRTDKGAKVSGVLAVKEGEKIAFGFDLEKASMKLWKRWPAHSFITSYWNNVAYDAMKATLPAMAAPIAMFQNNWMNSEIGVAGIVLRNGWFDATNLPVEKYVAPFIFPFGDTTLTGYGDFRGSFDHKRLAVEYDGRELKLGNDKFWIELDHIKDKEFGVYSAAHYFDFDKGTHYGVIPLCHATYWEKYSGLVFTEVTAQATLEGQRVHLNDVETFCYGIYLGGDIDIDFGEPYDSKFEAIFRPHTVSGRLSQLCHLLTDMEEPLIFQYLPIDGNVQTRKNGGRFHLIADATDYTVHAQFDGAISEGSYTSPDTDLSLQDFGVNIAYDHDKQTLNLTEIQGVILAGKPDNVEEYELSGDHISFSNFRDQEGAFDLWVGDKKRDIVRIVGQTKKSDDSNEDNPKIIFDFDREKTHFGDIHPETLLLTTREWVNVEVFKLTLDFSLNTVSHDFARLGRFGLFSLSHDAASYLANSGKTKGLFSVDVSYDNDYNTFSYNISGKELALGDFSFETFGFMGQKRGSIWTVDQLQFDELSLAAEATHEEDKWKINFLGMKYGPAMLMGMEGEYLHNEMAFHGRINLFEMNLEKMLETHAKSYVENWHTKGLIKGTGQIDLLLAKEETPYRVDLILNTALKSWEYHGLRMQDADNVSCHYISDKGITLRNLSTSLLDKKTGTSMGKIHLNKGGYEFDKNTVILEDFFFDIPSQNLYWLAENLSQIYPDLVTPEVSEMISSLKNVDTLKGSLGYESYPPYSAMTIRLNDGTYTFLDADHSVSDFLLEYDPFEFRMSSRYHYGERHFWLIANSSSSTLKSGEVILTDQHPTTLMRGQGKDVGMTLQWDSDPLTGMYLSGIEGNFSGIEADLKQNQVIPFSGEAVYLYGKVIVNLPVASPLFGRETMEQLKEWGVGDIFHLNGSWAMSKADPSMTNFNGGFSSHSLLIKGFQFDALTANLEYTPTKATITNLCIDDTCGTLKTDKIFMSRQTPNKAWTIDAPIIKVEKFRPSLLRSPEIPPIKTRRPLLIKELIVRDLKGSLSNKESLSGQGHLYFNNHSKKLLQNTIFQVPGEILSRLGLDPTVLTPVTGTITYDIHDGRVFLTKLKDMYSDSRLSKFYLPDNGFNSYLDFEGNLNVQVKMKQHNLLFKFAELFTFSIQGNLQKPTYNIQKQPKSKQGAVAKKGRT